MVYRPWCILCGTMDARKWKRAVPSFSKVDVCRRCYMRLYRFARSDRYQDAISRGQIRLISTRMGAAAQRSVKTGMRHVVFLPGTPNYRTAEPSVHAMRDVAPQSRAATEPFDATRFLERNRAQIVQPKTADDVARLAENMHLISLSMPRLFEELASISRGDPSRDLRCLETLLLDAARLSSLATQAKRVFQDRIDDMRSEGPQRVALAEKLVALLTAKAASEIDVDPYQSPREVMGIRAPTSPASSVFSDPDVEAVGAQMSARGMKRTFDAYMDLDWRLYRAGIVKVDPVRIDPWHERALEEPNGQPESKPSTDSALVERPVPHFSFEEYAASKLGFAPSVVRIAAGLDSELWVQFRNIEREKIAVSAVKAMNLSLQVRKNILYNAVYASELARQVGAGVVWAHFCLYVEHDRVLVWFDSVYREPVESRATLRGPKAPGATPLISAREMRYVTGNLFHEDELEEFADALGDVWSLSQMQAHPFMHA